MLCIGTFVDVGANVGDTLSSWYNEPSCALAPGKLRPKGVPCAWQWPWWLPLHVRRRWCAEAFEANPKFTSRLLRTGQRLAKRHGIRINVHAQTALSTRTGNATFGLDTLHGTGSSLQLHRHALDAKNRKGAGARVGDNTTTVRTVDATPFLDAVGGGGRVALKLDVEGSEYDILDRIPLNAGRHTGHAGARGRGLPVDAGDPQREHAPVAVAAVRECALCDHAAAVVLSVSLLCNRFNTTKNTLASFF